MDYRPASDAATENLSTEWRSGLPENVRQAQVEIFFGVAIVITEVTYCLDIRHSFVKPTAASESRVTFCKSQRCAAHERSISLDSR